MKAKQDVKKPAWLKYTKQEVEAIILKLADRGLTAEKIGLVLRDQYGIPDVRLFALKIKKVMKNKFQEPTEINLNKTFQRIIEHYKKNKQDKTAERSLIITKAKLKKREDYQKKF